MDVVIKVIYVFYISWPGQVVSAMGYDLHSLYSSVVSF